jgi:uncharacterized membrane protein
MSEEDETPKTKNHDNFVGAGISLGAGLGMVIGIPFHQSLWGLIVGAVLGSAIGIALAEEAKARDRKESKSD